MDFLYVTMPLSGVSVFWPGLVILGFGVGVIGGFFGIGGGWMVTPGLNILGFPMAYAIGTDLAHMAGKSLVSTRRHAQFGHVDYRLGGLMVVGTIAGFEAGAQTVMWLERLGKVDFYVRLSYLLLLGLVGWRILTDVHRNHRSPRENGEASAEPAPAVYPERRWPAAWIPPVVRFPRAGVRCSLWWPVLVGLITGWLSGLMGIGGGLIRVPALIYLLGCPTHVAVGTDLFEVAISGLYGAATYTYKGRTELTAALIMLAGASVGAQIGTAATKYVRGERIRSLLGVAVAGCAVSVLLKLAAAVQPHARKTLEVVAAVFILALVAALAAGIIRQFLRGMRAERTASRRPRAAAAR